MLEYTSFKTRQTETKQFICIKKVKNTLEECHRIMTKIKLQLLIITGLTQATRNSYKS